MGELRAGPLTDIHFVVPDGIDDPARPSGGNTYDRRLSRGLTSAGWTVHEHAVPGFWQQPDLASLAALDDLLTRMSHGAVVLLDGLIASQAPEVLVTQASRMRLVVLVHMPLGRTSEGAVLSRATAVVTTSDWTRRRLLDLYSLPADRVHVAEPGVDAAELAAGTATGESLLCVAAVIPAKGHDVLLGALATIADRRWHCACVGSLERDPEFVKALRSRHAGLKGRVAFKGPRTGAALERSYATADLLVLASRAEAYGMVVTEALARGVPVVASDVGGVREALGHGRPGLLVPPDDVDALAAALRRWLDEAELRAELRRAARERRGSLPTWATTASLVADVLAGASQ
jgi:glycosyltransferase involved in cell wall biosynthesis